MGGQSKLLDGSAQERPQLLGGGAVGANLFRTRLRVTEERTGAFGTSRIGLQWLLTDADDPT